MHIAKIMLLGCLACVAGCGEKSSSGTPAPKVPTQGVATGPGTGKPAKQVGSAFAALPDRGSLLAYRTQAAEVRGAFTYHPAEISEAHAWAAVGGSLNVNTPDGRQLSYRYQQLVEHADGNWSWIGKLPASEGGGEALVTFGAKAVFGIFSQAGHESLRLTTERGRAWIVETAAGQARQGDSAHPDGDILLPPPGGISGVGQRSGLTSGKARAGITAAAGNAVVDVVLGYTTGFAAGLGGTSQAVTRLSFLVDVSNQAFANSQMSERIRLVHTLEVDYPDDTENGATLEALTGFKSGTGSTAPDPRFAALRAARETHGGDLVSLVRKFRTPEASGCGIAWRLGDQGNIAPAESSFGYSVVADGTDVDEGDSKSYYCREETLVHELGHNLGQVHNPEDSSSPGVHPYAYGYRQAASNGFYTVMAYRMPDSSQTAIRYFASPNTLYAGSPTGVANSNDNVRSLTITMPMVQQFRPTAVASVMPRLKRDDFDRNGKSDIYWRNLADGQTAIWMMNGPAPVSTQVVYREPNQDWRTAAIGDFDGDGAADVFWRNRATGANFVQYFVGNQPQAKSSYSYFVGDVAWRVVAVADFNRDGTDDLYWRHSVSGQSVLWPMKNGMPMSMPVVYAEPDAKWVVAGTGDFDGDGYPDLFWRHAADGRNYVQFMREVAILGASAYVAQVADLAWAPVGFDDFDGDGRTDLLWRHGGSGQNTMWLMGGGGYPRQTANVYKEPDPQWQVVQTGDFDGDGKADVFWRHAGDGRNYIQMVAGLTMLPSSQLSFTVAPSWRVQRSGM